MPSRSTIPSFSSFRFWYFFLVFLVLSLAADFADALSASASSTSSSAMPTHAGIDLGTSGCRLSLVTNAKEEVFAQSIAWASAEESQSPDAWMTAVTSLLRDAVAFASASAANENDGEDSNQPPPSYRLQSICVSGTSATCTLTHASTGRPTRQGGARMYNYNVLQQSSDSAAGVAAMELIRKFVPPDNPANAPTSSLAKLLAWHEDLALATKERLCHQADYCCLRLCQAKACGKAQAFDVTSDWHNCLKLGYDVEKLEWPSWMSELLQDAGLSLTCLPARVVSPGAVVGTLDPKVAYQLGLLENDNENNPPIQLIAGTTDSNAAFLATDTAEFGTAVTSLGSTLALKLLAPVPVEDAARGVYSHRFPEVLLKENNNSDNNKQSATTGWLVGGASNCGCAILRQEGFSNEELERLSAQIEPVIDSGLEYYPLCRPGERFPVCDSNKPPVLEPVPASRARYLHGILEGLSRVEVAGYEALRDLQPQAVPRAPLWTAGGGSRNPMWTQLRQRLLRQAFGSTMKVEPAPNTEASYGAALLARTGSQYYDAGDNMEAEL